MKKDETPESKPKAPKPKPAPKKNRHQELMEHAIELVQEEAQTAGSITFSPRCILLATLPHRDPGNLPIFLRTNGNYTLSIEPGSKLNPDRISATPLGYPFGSIPRLVIAWITTEAVRTKSQEIGLGDNLADFLRQLDLGNHGGPRGDITRLRNQMDRLFASRIGFFHAGEKRDDLGYLRLIERRSYFWENKRNEQEDPKHATVTLTSEFYREIIERPVPLDLRVIHALKQSSLALDIYAWLTYRMSYLKKPTLIPWAALQLQFGSDYSRMRAFKENFLKQLAAVKLLYSHARFSTDSKKGITLYPSRPQVLKSF
jgi:hypothetical protein